MAQDIFEPQPDNNQIYQDPILKKYVELIKSKTNIFKSIYYGDPIRIPSSSLPALIITKLDTRARKETSADDMHEINISFTVVADIRDTISDDKEMVAGTNSLYNIMEGREEDLTLKTHSLLHILRNNILIDETNDLRTNLSTPTTVDYGMTVGKRGADSYGIEAVVNVIANFIQVR